MHYIRLNKQGYVRIPLPLLCLCAAEKISISSFAPLSGLCDVYSPVANLMKIPSMSKQKGESTEENPPGENAAGSLPALSWLRSMCT